jgi:hypothetical protein
MKYLVSHQGQQSGPFTVEEIVGQVRARQLDLFDYVFDEQKQDWVLLMEHADVAVHLKSNKPPRPPRSQFETPKAEAKTEVKAAPATEKKTSQAPETSPHVISEWFVLKGEHRFGPFSYVDVVKMLQQKVVFPFDFIWHAGLQDWKRVATIEEFSPTYIRQLFEKTGKNSDAFAQRKFKRSKFNGRVILHDNLTLWRGEGFEISRGGVGVLMKNGLIVPGQQLHVHFNAFEDFPAFNAVCEVVSKKFVNDDSPIEYGLRFLSMSADAQEEFYKKVSK